MLLFADDPAPPVIPPDVRSTVRAFLSDAAGQSHSSLDRSRAGKRTAVHRLILQCMCVLQVLGIIVPSLIIAGTISITDDSRVIVRSLALALSFLITGIMTYLIGRVVDVEQNFLLFFAGTVVCTAFEATLFCIANNLPTLFYFGLVAMMLRFVELVVAGAGMRICAALCPRDELYSHFADIHEDAQLKCQVDQIEFAVRERLLANKTNELPEAGDNFQESLDRAVMEQNFIEQEAAMQKLIKATSLSLGGIREEFARHKSAVRENDSSKKPLELPAGPRKKEEEEELSLTMQLQTVTPGTPNELVELVRQEKIDLLRRTLFDFDKKRRTIIVALLAVIFLCAAGNVVYEMLKIFLNQQPIFDSRLNVAYNNKKNFQTYLPQRTHSTWKVHLVVVDGLRYDLTAPGSSVFGDYIASLGSNAYRLHSKAQLPSFSVPNWMTILTGTPPENTGVTGNLQNGETSFDTIFSQAKNYNLSTGLTGTPWWSALVASVVPKLSGDGTVDAGYVPPGWPAYPKLTSDPADWERLRVALLAIQRSQVAQPFGTDDYDTFYSFFLTHFSDVDKQGHEYGISTTWNKDDSYMRAVANKTQCIQSIVDALDSSTLLIITADHGHLQRGGHGGVEPELLDVPIIFYTNSMSLAPSAPVNFPPDLYPRATRDGKLYSNLDLSATICAILGIATPRQSIGVFIEEAVDMFVPSAVRAKHYYDLLVAKYSIVLEYKKQLETSLWAGATFDIDGKEQIDALVATQGSLTEKEYADGVRLILPSYWSMRNIRLNYVEIRNLLMSIGVIIPFFLLVHLIFQRTTCDWPSLLVKLPQSEGPSDEASEERQTLTDNFLDDANLRSHLRAYNRRAFLSALLTLVLLVGLSIAIFFIAYKVYGYTIWDSTLTHNPDTAPRFIISSIIGPTIVFLFLTRLFMFRHVHWHSWNVVSEFKLSKWVDTAGNIVRWIRYVMTDIQTLCLAPVAYTTRGMLSSYLYILYLTHAVFFYSLLLLFLTFPFAFVVPIMYSNTHVTEFNLEFRFRIMTLLLMIIPAQVGCAILLLALPTYQLRTMLQWDLVLLVGYIFPDTVALRTQYAIARKRNQVAPEEETQSGGEQDEAEKSDLARRKVLLEVTCQFLLKAESRSAITAV